MNYTIQRDPLTGTFYELTTAPGWSLDDAQHYAFAETKRELVALAKSELQPCYCDRCAHKG